MSLRCIVIEKGFGGLKLSTCEALEEILAKKSAKNELHRSATLELIRTKMVGPLLREHGGIGTLWRSCEHARLYKNS